VQDRSPNQSTDMKELIKPLCTLIMVHNDNGQQCSTETDLLIFSFLQTCKFICKLLSMYS